jgi:midasin
LVKFFPRGPLHFITTISSVTLVPPQIERLHRLLLAYSRIQQFNRELPTLLNWSLSPLITLMLSTEHNIDDNGVKLLAIRCYAYQSGMGEAEREKLEAKVLRMKEGEMCSVDCWVSDGGFVSVEKSEGEKMSLNGNGMLDGWVLPGLEVQRVRHMREEICRDENGVDEFYVVEEGKEAVGVGENDLRYV